MLRLRRGTVSQTEPLKVRVGDEERRAWADEDLVGPALKGDEVLVNVGALDLGLGSGGFDVVHANLTRGLDAEATDDDHVMKLNYTSLQHPVHPVEATAVDDLEPRPIPVLVLALHGQLAPAAWAVGNATTELRVGYVQTAGGALPGGLSKDVAELRAAGLLDGHVTAAPAYGGELEAITVAGALQAAAGPLGWDAVIAGPGPGIIGSETSLGHGGLVALDTAHAALALGMETMIAPRMSNGDPRPRHRGLSHHTAKVLELLLGAVRVPAPALVGDISATTWGIASNPLDQLSRACGERHQVEIREAPLREYAESGLSATTMGRDFEDDRLFYAAALAAGEALAEATLVERWGERSVAQEGGGEAGPPGADRVGPDGHVPVRRWEPVD